MPDWQPFSDMLAHSCNANSSQNLSDWTKFYQKCPFGPAYFGKMASSAKLSKEPYELKFVLKTFLIKEHNWQLWGSFLWMRHSACFTRWHQRYLKHFFLWSGQSDTFLSCSFALCCLAFSEWSDKQTVARVWCLRKAKTTPREFPDKTWSPQLMRKKLF